MVYSVQSWHRDPAQTAAGSPAVAGAVQPTGRDRPGSSQSRDTADRVELSPEARRETTSRIIAAPTPAAGGTENAGDETPPGTRDDEGASRDPAQAAEGARSGEPSKEAGPEQARGSDGKGLSKKEQDEIARLAARDAEVRRHEMAHMSAGGVYAGTATYEYETGPDGRRYAVGGEVSVDVSPVAGDPQKTIAKMQTVRRAALAPADPSGPDRAVAASATRTEQQARMELTRELGKKIDDVGIDGAAPMAEPAETPTKPEAGARRWDRATDAYTQAGGGPPQQAVGPRVLSEVA